MKTFEGREVILEVRAGSHLYGTNTPESDVDIRGIVLPRIEEIIGLDRFEQKEKHGDEDVLYYSLPRYIQLLMKGNPNVIEWLFATPAGYTWVSGPGFDLLENGHRFLSKKFGLAALGYLNGQTKRMHSGGPTGQLGAKRKATVEKYGYDTKNAGHAVRLAREITELFDTGSLNVRRKDRDFLIAIRNGSLSLDSAMNIINEETAKAEAAFEANKAGLPEEPDKAWANAFLIRVQRGIVTGGN